MSTSEIITGPDRSYSESNNWAIEASSIYKIYPQGLDKVQALSDFSYTFNAGKTYAINGPSGSGKSSLLRIIGLIDRPSSGTLKIGNNSFSQDSSEQYLRNFRLNKIGFVFQNFELLSYLNAAENVSLSLELIGVPSKIAINQAKEILSYFGLDKRFDHLPDQLSGGEKQRVALARALIKKPAVIIADEPTGSLDSNSGKIVIESLLRAASFGTSVLIATHSEALSNSCDHSIKLKDGSLGD